MPHTCETCSHWQPQPIGSSIRKAIVGECRSKPPISDWKWPRTRSDDFCSVHSAAQAVAFAAAPAPTPAPEALPEAEPLPPPEAATAPSFSLGGLENEAETAAPPPVTGGKTRRVRGV